MRAWRAYLAGIGSAGALLLGMAVLFTVASAILAFHGWPSDHGAGRPARQVLSVRASRKGATPTTNLAEVPQSSPHGATAGLPGLKLAVAPRHRAFRRRRDARRRGTPTHRLKVASLLTAAAPVVRRDQATPHPVRTGPIHTAPIGAPANASVPAPAAPVTVAAAPPTTTTTATTSTTAATTTTITAAPPPPKRRPRHPTSTTTTTPTRSPPTPIPPPTVATVPPVPPVAVLAPAPVHLPSPPNPPPVVPNAAPPVLGVQMLAGLRGRL